MSNIYGESILRTPSAYPDKRPEKRIWNYKMRGKYWRISKEPMETIGLDTYTSTPASAMSLLTSEYLLPQSVLHEVIKAQALPTYKILPLDTVSALGSLIHTFIQLINKPK